MEALNHIRMNPANVSFIAVHVGAGFHSVQKTGAYRILCDTICTEIMGMLNSGCDARQAAARAVELLEVIEEFATLHNFQRVVIYQYFLKNSPLTNAGIGSNLTLGSNLFQFI